MKEGKRKGRRCFLRHPHVHPGHHVNICTTGGAKFSALTGKKVGVLVRVNAHVCGDPLNNYCNVLGNERNGALDCLDELRVGFAFPTAGQAADTVLRIRQDV